MTPIRPHLALLRLPVRAAEDAPGRLAAAYVGRLAPFAVAWFFGLLSIGMVLRVGGIRPGDTWAYWWSAHGPMYLSGTALDAVNYIYPPPFAQVIAPLAALPASAFAAIWSASLMVAFAWLLWPLAPATRLGWLVAFAPLAVMGNAMPLLAVALVVGMRRPAAWALLLLTKVTPGVGLLWFLARREWRPLAIALGATVAVAAISFLAAPDQWFAWRDAILADRAHLDGMSPFAVPGLGLRLAMSAALVVWGARTDRAWTLAPALAWANPDIVTVTLGLLAAVPRLVQVREAMQPVPVALRG